MLRDVPPSKFIRIYAFRSQPLGIRARHRVYFDARYLEHRIVGVLVRQGSTTKELISNNPATHDVAVQFAQRCCLLGWSGPMIQCMNTELGCVQPNPLRGNMLLRMRGRVYLRVPDFRSVVRANPRSGYSMHRRRASNTTGARQSDYAGTDREEYAVRPPSPDVFNTQHGPIKIENDRRMDDEVDQGVP